MIESRFPILGEEIPPLLGRSKIMQRLWNNLTKKTPSHLSVVGPRFIGKSVLLKALEQQMCREGSPYGAVIRWDLGHQTPRSDEEFMKLLCRQLGAGIESANSDYGKHLLSVEADEYSEICEVMDALHDDSQKILMLWDGFDKPLSGGTLTRNLWDNLLDLCRKPSFRLVTSTRKELQQLIRDEKSVTSDFWGVFEGVVRVGPFDEQDVDDILAGLSEHKFQPGAKTELANWSGMLPPLFLEILNHILAELPRGQIDNSMINRAAIAAGEKRAAMLSMLWEDCSAGAKDLYTVLVKRGELPVSGTGKEERKSLFEKGIALESGSKLKPACRMLQEHIRGSGPDPGSIARLFGTWEDYRINIRSFLERRLAHISRFDNRLYHLIEQIISDIPDYPDDCLNNLNNIRDCALKLIWQHEFGASRCVPHEVITHWTASPRSEHRLVKGMMNSNCWDVPTDPLDQIRLLSLLTGSYRNFEAKAKWVSKDTYILIDAIHNFRNRAQHPDGQSIHLGVAVAAIMTCLELLACLERELSV